MEFTVYSIVILAFAFWWSGFVRAGLGFGGAGLMYPIALLAVDSVIFLVPIVCIQLIIFSGTTLLRDYRRINWRVAGGLLGATLPAILAGVFGLINLPQLTVLLMLYLIIGGYALSYIFNFRVRKPSKWLEIPSLLVGGYASGMALAGAPIIAAVGIRYLEKEQVRATLFVIWILTATIKLITLYSFDVDLQLRHQVWLLPMAFAGHLIGMRLHDRLLGLQSSVFYRWMGIGLLSLSLIGLTRHLFLQS
jgi:uncharacterized protein